MKLEVTICRSLLALLLCVPMLFGCAATSARPVQTGAGQTVASSQPVSGVSMQDVQQALTATVGASVGRLEASIAAKVDAEVAAIKGNVSAIAGDLAAVKTSVSQTAQAGRDVNNTNSGSSLLWAVLGVMAMQSMVRVLDNHWTRKQNERHYKART